MKKRLLALLCLVCLLIGSVPLYAAADGGEETGQKPISFPDVTEDKWYYDVVMYCAENGIVQGMFGYMKPDDAVTRAQFVTMLYRLCEDEAVVDDVKLPFVDMSKGGWYEKPIQWAYQNQIVNGVTSTRFDPDRTVTRAEICALLCRFCQYMGYALPEYQYDGYQFYDILFDSGHWAKNYVYSCYQAGIVNGIGYKQFQPAGKATRAQVAAVLQRMLRYCTTERTDTPDAENAEKTNFTYADRFGCYAEGYYIAAADGSSEELYWTDGRHRAKGVMRYDTIGNLIFREETDSSGECLRGTYSDYSDQGYPKKVTLENGQDGWVNYTDLVYDESGNVLTGKIEASYGNGKYQFDGEYAVYDIVDTDGQPYYLELGVDETGERKSYLQLEKDTQYFWKVEYFTNQPNTLPNALYFRDADGQYQISVHALDDQNVDAVLEIPELQYRENLQYEQIVPLILKLDQYARQWDALSAGFFWGFADE